MRGQPLRFRPGHAARSPTRLRTAITSTDFATVDCGYTTPCWLMLIGVRPDGYSRIKFRGRFEYAHRAMWIQERGAIPEGKELDHLCKQRACVNPEHLEVVEPRHNARRSTKTKLTWEQVEAIRRDPRHSTAIAAEYEIGYTYVCAIRQRRFWRDE